MIEMKEGAMSPEFKFALETIAKMVEQRQPEKLNIFVKAEVRAVGLPVRLELLNLAWTDIMLPHENWGTPLRLGQQIKGSLVKQHLLALDDYQRRLIWEVPQAQGEFQK